MTADEIVDLLVELGSTPSVEGVSFTELDHGLQCAAELARRFPRDHELQAAGLVHDIGHRFGSDEDHGRLGAEAVRPALGARVAALVESHVAAKRYLVATDPDYAARLSPDSVRTLALQGGALSPAEVTVFVASRHGPDAAALRRADDDAKVPGRAVPPLGHWIPLLRSTPP